MCDLSIIVVNYNTVELLRGCLNSIVEETRDVTYEIIVVDNASTDGSRAMLEKEFPQVVKIYNPDNKGFAAANNQGIKECRGDYILLLNSDTIILDRAIQKTLAFMKRNLEAGIVGCKLLNNDKTLQPSCMSFPSLWNLFSEAFFLYILFRRTEPFGSYYLSYFDYDQIRSVDVVKGAFMMVRREIFDTIGLLDESYFMYTEETDFCYRAKQHGYQVFFIPTAEIIHLGGRSVENTRWYIEQLHHSQFQFIRSHFKGVRKWMGMFIKELGILLRIPVYFLTGIFTLDARYLKKALFYSAVFWKVIL